MSMLSDKAQRPPLRDSETSPPIGGGSLERKVRRRSTARTFTAKERLFGNLKALREEILMVISEKGVQARLLWYVDAAISWESLISDSDQPGE